jgi:DNA-binding PucR family transcriptional regulator
MGESGHAALQGSAQAAESAGADGESVAPAGDRHAPEEDIESSLASLLESLGTDIVRVVAHPQGLDVPVGDTVIYDRTERSTITSGAIVLGVGVRPGTVESSTLMAAAGESGAAAVVVKETDGIGDLARDATSRGVALLSVPEEMTWTQLHAFLVNASRFSAQRASVGGIAGVPLGDLFALSNAIAGVVGGAVTIEDASRRVLAYSTLDQPIDMARRGSILGRQVPDSPEVRALYRQVVSSTGVWTMDTESLQRILGRGLLDMRDVKHRSAIAIRAGSQAIGSIWVVHDDYPLVQESEQALVEAARIAAPHMIQARAARDVERRMRAEMLLAVLDGRASAETASRLGFTATAPVAVLAFELVADGSSVDELRRERLVDLVAVNCEAFYRQTAAVTIGSTVYALLQGERKLDDTRLARLAQQAQAHAEARLDAALLAAIGSTVESVRDVARSRREAERVLGVLRADRGARTFASIGDVQSEVVLDELRELSVDHPGLTRGKLERVIAYDAARRTTHAQTLRAYLDAFGDITQAAARISIHPNTFRYRMRRLGELFELDLRNPEERLVIELQLRLQPDADPGAPTDTTTSEGERSPSKP